jgi:glycosyltransferase involved in cell wall biosynthesis
MFDVDRCRSKKFSFIVPIYNDGYLAEAFCEKFIETFTDWTPLPVVADRTELIFVNDGSTDNSMGHLKRMAERFPFVRVIELSRNFGQHIALTSGYHFAKGDFVGMLNVDMEDPPSEIPKLLEYIIMNEDCDIVLGIRPARKGSYFVKLTSLLFNIFLNKLTGYNIPTNVATLRIMNRKFIDAYNSLTEKSRYIPGLEKWLGFKHGYIPIQHQSRKNGQSSYNFKRRLVMALESVMSFSDLPLRLITFFGMLVAFIGFMMISIIIVQKIFFVNFQAGYVSTLAVIVFLSGIQIIVIGMASLYIGRILKEVQNRPLYVIRNKINL